MQENTEATDTQTSGGRSNPATDIDASSLLPQAMPSPIALSMAGFLILATIIAGLFVIFVPFPETVESPFQLMPSSGLESIEAPRDGIVQQVAVREGTFVRSGTMLFSIRSEQLRELTMERLNLRRELADHQARQAQLLAEARIQKLTEPAALAALQALTNTPAVLSADKDTSPYGDNIQLLREQTDQLRIQAAEQKLQELRDRLPLLQQRVATAKRLLDRLDNAYRRQLTPEADVIRQEYEYQQALLEREQLPYQIQVAETELQRVQTESRLAVQQEILATAQRDAELRRLRFAIETDQARLTALDRELQDADQDTLTVYAPYDGTIVDLNLNQVGAIVERNDVLCRLAPLEAELRVELRVAEKAVGQLQAGQQVRLLFDAFPYTRFGVHLAELDWVSPVAEGGRFLALASLPEKTLFAAGQERLLRAGMGGSARITVGQRTLLDYALEPLRQLNETLGMTSRI